MSISRQRATNAQPIRSGLFLRHGSGLAAPVSRGAEKRHELRPLDTGFDFDGPGLGIELQNALQCPRIDQFSIFGKLLAARCVTPSRDAYGLAVSAGATNDLPQLVQ